jgi:soluble lytic murein transglycosylase-like protein
MVLKWGAVLCCTAALLAIAWVPVAFVVNGGSDDARQRVASFLDVGRHGAAVLPAAGLDTAFLNPQLVPTLEPRPLESADSSADRGRGRHESSARYGARRTGGLSPDLSRRPYARLVERAADRHGVDPRLVHALIEVESSYRPDAVSTAGAMGLMQLMPVTASRYGVGDPLDPEANIEAGTRHLRTLLDEFGPLFALDALAAYHAGETVVRRHGGIPPYPQTHRFVRRVMNIVLSQTSWGGGD